MGLGFQHGKQQFKRTLFEIYEHMKRGSYNELCSCVETVITVISAVFRGNYVSSLSCRVRQSSLPGQGPKIYFGDALTIVFHLVLGFFLPSVSKGKAKWECWPYWEQSSECTVYTIVVVEQRRHSHLPSSCSLVLLFTLVLVLMFWAVLWTRSRKGSKTKAWQGGEKGFFVLFSSSAVCLLRIVLTQPRVVNRGAEVEATYTSFLVNAEIQCNCTLRPEELCFMQGQKQNRPCLQRSPATCNDLLWSRFNWLHWTLNSRFFVQGWGPKWWGCCFKQNGCSCPEGKSRNHH